MLLKTILNFFLLLEEITNTPFCMYIFWLARAGLNLLSQSSDMDIHRPDIPRIVIAPYQIQKILPVENLIRIRDQKLKKVKFLGRQIHFTLTDKDSSAVQINTHITRNNCTLCRLFLLSSLCTTDDRLDTCLDLQMVLLHNHPHRIQGQGSCPYRRLWPSA